MVNSKYNVKAGPVDFPNRLDGVCERKTGIKGEAT